MSLLPGYTIDDPTSIFVTNSSWHAVVTVSRYPNYVTFDQRHMTTQVFKVESDVLGGLIERACKRGASSVPMVDCS